MLKIALTLSLCLIAAPAFANCKADATGKLAGAALSSFMTKCETMRSTSGEEKRACNH